MFCNLRNTLGLLQRSQDPPDCTVPKAFFFFFWYNPKAFSCSNFLSPLFLELLRAYLAPTKNAIPRVTWQLVVHAKHQGLPPYMSCHLAKKEFGFWIWPRNSITRPSLSFYALVQNKYNNLTLPPSTFLRSVPSITAPVARTSSCSLFLYLQHSQTQLPLRSSRVRVRGFSPFSGRTETRWTATRRGRSARP